MALPTPRCWGPAAVDVRCPSRCLPQQGHPWRPRAPLPAPSCLLQPPRHPCRSLGAGRRWQSAAGGGPRFPVRQERSHSEHKGRSTCYPRAAARALRTGEHSCKINGFLVRGPDMVWAWSGSSCSKGSCTYPQSSFPPAPTHTRCPGPCSFPPDKAQGQQDTRQPNLSAAPSPSSPLGIGAAWRFAADPGAPPAGRAQRRAKRV